MPLLKLHKMFFDFSLKYIIPYPAGKFNPHISQTLSKIHSTSYKYRGHLKTQNQASEYNYTSISIFADFKVHDHSVYGILQG